MTNQDGLSVLSLLKFRKGFIFLSLIFLQKL